MSREVMFDSALQNLVAPMVDMARSAVAEGWVVPTASPAESWQEDPQARVTSTKPCPSRGFKLRRAFPDRRGAPALDRAFSQWPVSVAEEER